MIKKTITYTNYNGEEISEPFYFNLSVPELLEMDAESPQGLIEQLQGMLEKKDEAAAFQWYKNFISKAYGEKSPDGKYFDKSEELSRRFLQSAAYEQLFRELVYGGIKEFEVFLTGILPKEAQQAMDQDKPQLPRLNSVPTPSTPPAPPVPPQS